MQSIMTLISTVISKRLLPPRRGGGGRVLPIIAYTVRLRPRGVPFQALGVYMKDMKGQGLLATVSI